MLTSVRWICRAAAIGLAAIAFHVFCVLPWRVNRILRVVEARSRMALDAPSSERAVILARRNLTDLDAIAPAAKLDVTFHFLYASNARMLGREQQALDHYNAALRADHRPEIYFDRGLTLLEMGRPDDAMPDFVTSVRFNPSLVNDLDVSMRRRVLDLAKHP